MDEQIPFFDLSRQIREIMPELQEAISGVLNRGQFILGDPVERLEESIALMVKSPAAVAVASGTDGLLLTLRALGVKEGDTVITTPFTFFSTASTIVRLGARPLFVDINPESFNISHSWVERLVGENCHEEASGNIRHIPTDSIVKGIVPVHLFGLMAEMKPLKDLAESKGLFILEDAAQALGAWQEGLDGRLMAGSVGDAGVYSFYPTKNLGAFGDAGMVVTRREDVAGKVRRLRVHGASARDRFEEVGYLSRMDTLQAAVLLAKLPHLEKWNRRRAELAAGYIQRIESYKWAQRVVLPRAGRGESDKGHIYHQFVIRVDRRDDLVNHLRSLGIGCETYYSRPLHLQPALSYLGYRRGDLPEAEKAANETLELPIWPELTESEQDRVVEAMNIFYN